MLSRIKTWNPYVRVYALMWLVDIILLSLISWVATIPLSSLWVFVPLAAFMFSITAFATYKLDWNGVWWLLISLLICDAFITIQFFVLAKFRMNIVDVFRDVHRDRITFMLTLLPEIIAHIVGAFYFYILRIKKR